MIGLEGLIPGADWYKRTLAMGDPRVETWPLMSSPGPVIMIFLLYLATIRQAPKLMESQKPFDITKFVIGYNIVLVVLSAYMCYEFFMSSFLAGYSLICQPVDYSMDPLAIRMASVCWWYFFSKVIELIDTVFLVVRKKPVSFLHAYHHSTMLLNWWLGVKYVAGGQFTFTLVAYFLLLRLAFFLALLNTFVHVIMYSYFGLSALGPHMQKYLWWKKYLTSLQLTQFIVVIIHTAVNMFYATDCRFPRGLNVAVFLYAISLLILFSNFYRKTYTKQKSS